MATSTKANLPLGKALLGLLLVAVLPTLAMTIGLAWVLVSLGLGLAYLLARAGRSFLADYGKRKKKQEHTAPSLHGPN